MFEIEDQRNWTDASFKTYSTPVGLPVPHRAHAGQRFRQHVRVHVRGGARAPRRTGGRTALTLGTASSLAFPPVGTMLGAAPSRAERALVAALAPAHLRVELEPPIGVQPIDVAEGAPELEDL